MKVKCEAWVANRGGLAQAGPVVRVRVHSLFFDEHAGGSLGSFGANTTLEYNQHTASASRKTVPCWRIVGIKDVEVIVGVDLSCSQKPEMWLSVLYS